MKLTIHIEFDHTDDQAKQAKLLQALAELGMEATPKAAPRKEVQKREAAPEATPTEAPKNETPVKEKEAAKVTKTQKAEEPEVDVTIEEIRVLAANKKRAGHTAELKAILNEFNAAKLSDLDKEDYNEFAAKVKAL